MSKIRATYDTSDARVELDRLSRGFDQKTRKAMAGRFEQLWQETQKAVHVETGALRRSGRRYVRDNDNGFRGTITYGGYTPVAGKNPVVYALIENEREGDRTTAPFTPHRFFDEDIKPAFLDIEDIVEEWLVGDKRKARRQMGRL